MSKTRRTREVLGVLTRADGVAVEIKQPTIWATLTEQRELVLRQQQALETMAEMTAKLEREVSAARVDSVRGWEAYHRLRRHWWTNLGAWLGVWRENRGIEPIADSAPEAAPAAPVTA